MNDRRLLLLGIPLLALLVLVPRGLLRVESGAELGVAWSISLGFTTAFWLSGRALWRTLIRRLPRVSQTSRRLWLLAGTNTLTTAAITLGLNSLFAALRHQAPAPAHLLREFGLNMVPTVLVQLVYESRHFFEQWKANLLRADQLAAAQTQAQLDALAQQLDPHFLFNSLNTLAALIEPGNGPAQAYLDGLADVYRYVLLARERPTVPLAEELAFVRTYVALQQVRFRDNLRVRYDIDPAALARHVASLSVQLLVENALKHNEASRAHPLTLRLRADADALTVENTWQPRPAGLVAGTGTGLANVRQRYALLGAARPVAVVQAADSFAVTLPLLGVEIKQ